MAGKFKLKQFGDINLNDPFFDSLKADYPGSENSTGFVEWFRKKAEDRRTALVFEDEDGVGAFLGLKPEAEGIVLTDRTLPSIQRMKISTIKISERYRGQRIGEGAVGMALWKWQQAAHDEIYVTVFDKHADLIALFEKYGFNHIGYNRNGERVYLRSRKAIDFSDPFKAFPFISSSVNKASYIFIED